MAIKLLYILESNIKKYKDEKSLQEISIIIFLMNRYLKKKINEILDFFIFLYMNIHVLIFNLKINIIKTIQLFFIIRFFFIFTYALLNFLLISISFIINFEFSTIIYIFKEIFLEIANSNIAFCMEENFEMGSEVDSEGSEMGSEGSEVDSEGSEVDSEGSSDRFSITTDVSMLSVNSEFRYNLEAFRETEAFSWVDRFYSFFSYEYIPFTYFSGAPYINGIINLNSISTSIIIENNEILDKLEGFFHLMDYKNIPISLVSEKNLFLTKNEYLNIFTEIIKNIDFLINQKYCSNINFINFLENKIVLHQNSIDLNIYTDILNKIFFEKAYLDLKETNIPININNYMTPIDNNILSFLNNDFNLINHLKFCKNILINNSNIINNSIINNDENIFINNELSFNFILPDFNENSLRFSSISELRFNYNTELMQNNYEEFRACHHFDFEIRSPENIRFFNENGFQITN